MRSPAVIKLFESRAALFLCAVTLLVLASCSRTPEHPLLPMGSLDAPANGTTVTGRVPVGGWALSEDTVESVGVYLDRRYLLDAQLGNVRPDVQKAYPRFREAGTAGWTAVLDLTNVAAGPHTIQAQIRSKTGGMTTFEHGVTVR